MHRTSITRVLQRYNALLSSISLFLRVSGVFHQFITNIIIIAISTGTPRAYTALYCTGIRTTYPTTWGSQGSEFDPDPGQIPNPNHPQGEQTQKPEPGRTPNLAPKSAR